MDDVESKPHVARPFIKWAGSKKSLISKFVQHFPKRYNTYFEPFLGGGSVFLHLAPDRARLSDASQELIDLWCAVRDHPERICEKLAGKVPEREAYYEMRGNRSTNSLDRAIEFIYLNKSCWNGLFRVNSKGQFNVPFGTGAPTPIIDPENIMACSKLLKKESVYIQKQDFEESTSTAKAGDFVFFDPPYVTQHNFNGFRDYNEKLFSWSDQVRLASEAKRLVARGVHVLVTNADHEDVRSLYDGFELFSIERASTLANDPKKRGRVTEAVFKGTK